MTFSKLPKDSAVTWPYSRPRVRWSKTDHLSLSPLWSGERPPAGAQWALDRHEEGPPDGGLMCDIKDWPIVSSSLYTWTGCFVCLDNKQQINLSTTPLWKIYFTTLVEVVCLNATATRSFTRSGKYCQRGFVIYEAVKGNIIPCNETPMTLSVHINILGIMCWGVFRNLLFFPLCLAVRRSNQSEFLICPQSNNISPGASVKSPPHRLDV